jgi:hypothetical protein
VLGELDTVVVAGDEVTLRIGSEGMDDITTSGLRELVQGFRGGASAR